MRTIITILIMTMIIAKTAVPQQANSLKRATSQEFKYLTEQFADAKILRYQVPGFERLSLNQKILVYYLGQAGLCGRDIIYDQNFKSNLLIRKTLETIYLEYKGNRSSDEFRNFTVYLKRVWFCNGIHHHYSTDKFYPELSQSYFESLISSIPNEKLPLAKGQSKEKFIKEIKTLVFDQTVAPKRVSLDPDGDLLLQSASNYYEGLTQAEAEEFYEKMKQNAADNNLDTLISFGLNSKLVKEKGKIIEKTYKSGGLYGPAIDRILFWLLKASTVTETPEQKNAIDKLIAYYKSGSLKTWDEYNIAWVKDLGSMVDFVNGFIEVYGDPLAMKGSWESVVNFKDVEATKRTEILSANAQYFEDNSPVDKEFKKKEVKGVSAKVITVTQLGGDCHPTTPIGINLPNANWIRKDYGSKSVTMDNITRAYDEAAKGNGFLEEFASSKEEIARAVEFGHLAGNLTTDLHECLGHGSGQLLEGVGSDALKNYHSTIEEARADLFALYYIKDPMMIKLGLIPNEEVAMAEYDSFIRNGLMTQLVRVQPGKTIEESHMRDRALISRWVYEKGLDRKVIEKFIRNGKIYYRINDYGALRELFGELLRIVQRITSEGSYKEARELVETYAVSVDPLMHKQVLDRYRRLNIAPYAGFINPEYTLETKGETITDVKIEYPDDFTRQMLNYSSKYSFLPIR